MRLPAAGAALVGGEGPRGEVVASQSLFRNPQGAARKPGAISKLNQALDPAGVSYTTEIYPGTIHGFTMSDTDAFNRSWTLSDSEHRPAGGRERSSAAWSGGRPRRPVAVFRHRAVAAAKP